MPSSAWPSFQAIEADMKASAFILASTYISFYGVHNYGLFSHDCRFWFVIVSLWITYTSPGSPNSPEVCVCILFSCSQLRFIFAGSSFFIRNCVLAENIYISSQRSQLRLKPVWSSVLIHNCVCSKYVHLIRTCIGETWILYYKSGTLCKK